MEARSLGVVSLLLLSALLVAQAPPLVTKVSAVTLDFGSLSNANSTRVNIGFIDVFPAEGDTRVQDNCGSVNTTHGGLALVVAEIVPPNTQSGCINFMRSQGDVKYAVPDGNVRAMFTPNDPLYLNNEQWAPQKIRAPEAWDIVQNGNAKIGFIDSGASCTHLDLIDNCNAVAPAVATDACGHGSHVAGIAAAGLNNSLYIAGLINTEFRAYLGLPLSIPSQGCAVGFVSTVSIAIMEAKDAGMKIISMSIGTVDPTCQNDPFGQFCQPLEDAVKAAHNASILLIAAAGNQGADNSVVYPAKFAEMTSSPP